MRAITYLNGKRKACVDKIAVFIGHRFHKIILRIMHDRKKDIYSSFRYHKKGFINRILTIALKFEFENKSEEEQLKIAKCLWSGTGGLQWFNDQENLGTFNLKKRQIMVKQIKKLLESGNFKTICEIGVGDGYFLDYLQKETKAECFIGIDINKQQIEKNAEKYKTLRFICGDLVPEEIRKISKSNIIFIACRTLTMLTQSKLEHTIKQIAQMAGSAVCIFEQSQIDLEREFQSKVRGVFFYSHNYPYLFLKHGFKIRDKEIIMNDSRLNDYGICVTCIKE
jgi:hypothetical protein